MTIRRRMTAALAAALTLGAVLAGSATGQERELRIATEGAFPPFNLVENGEPAGFEIDLAKALCAEMKVRCSFVLHEWDGIIKGLLNKEYDAIVASLAITDRRKLRIAFSRSYYRMPSAFIAQKDDAPADIRPETLAGKRIGVVDRSEHARYLEERYEKADIRVYAKLEEAALDLLTDRLDLVHGDRLALTRFLDSREGACCRIVAEAPRDPRYFGEGVGIGLRKEDVALKESFDKAIEALIANGRYDAIRAKYFPFDVK